MTRTKMTPKRFIEEGQEVKEEINEEIKVEVGKDTLKIKSNVGKRPRKKYRKKNGKAAEKEMRDQQKKTSMEISRAGFQRVIRELAGTIPGIDNDISRFTSDALEVLQVAGEDFIVDRFQQACIVMTESKDVQLQPRHTKIADILYARNRLVDRN